MSQTTSAIFYSSYAHLIDGSYIEKCFALSGASATGGVSLEDSSQSAWRAFVKGADLSQKSKWLGQALAIETVSSFVSKGSLLTVNLHSPLMLERIRSGVLNGINPFTYGSHCPNSMGLNVGWHDIYDEVENEDGHFYARASFSISFWGPQIPNDLSDYRARFFQLPEVLAVKKDLEDVLGTLDSCLILNV